MRVLSAIVVLALIASASAADRCPSIDGDIPMAVTATSATFNSPIGIDWHEPTDTLLMSVHYSNGSPFNFARVQQDGTIVQFSSISGYTDEVKIATVKSGAVNMGGFVPGQMYVGTGASGVIARVDPSGTNVDSTWAQLGNVGLFRGSLYHDRTGVWGGNLIAVTTSGYVFSVNANGVGTQLAHIGGHLEGLIVLPNNAADWGPWAGAIMIGAENSGKTWLVKRESDGSYSKTSFELGIDVEDLDIIVPNANFFGVNYGGSKIMGITAEQWAPHIGKVLAVQEFDGHGLTLKAAVIGWSPFCGTNGGFYLRKLTSSNNVSVQQWEHVTFAHSGLIEVPIATDCEETLVQECPDGAYPTGDDRVSATSDTNCACLTFDAAGNAVACVN